MTRISLRNAKLRNLVVLYKIYFNALRGNTKNWTRIQLDMPQATPKLTLQRVLMVHAIHILYARLYAVARTGSVLALFQTRWDPLILEVLAKDHLIGCIFLARQSATVFQIDVIASIEPKQEKWTLCEVFWVLKQYVKKLGIKRIIIRSIEEDIKQALKQCGFESAYYDSVLFIHI